MRDRGVSEVVGFALVFSLIVSMVLIVSVSGVGTLKDARNAEQADNAERAFEVMGDNMADIYEHDAPSRATEIDLKDSSLYVGRPIWINVSARDGAGNEETVTARSVPLVYRVNDDTRIVFEGGALFRTRGDAGVVVQPPPLVSGPERSAVPVLAYRGDEGRSVGGTTVLVRARKSGATLPIADTDGSWDTIWYNVTSPRYELWNRTLSATQGVEGCRTPEEGTVACTLTAPSKRLYVTKTTVEVELDV